jgi:hypothetical protein
MAGSEREQLIAEMVERYRQLLEHNVARDPQTLEEIEGTVEHVSQQLERELQQRLLEQQENLPQRPENQARCSCGAMARFRERRARVLVTRHAELWFWRRYYHCQRCRRGFAPLDEQLGLDGSGYTLQVRVWSALLGAHLPFAQAAIALEQLTGVKLGSSTIERLTVTVGKSLRKREVTTAQQHRLGQLRQPEHRPRRLYIGMDGKMVPLREAWKRDGSSGELVCRWGECKTGVVYEAHAGPTGDQGVSRKSYIATLSDAKPFGLLLATVAHQRGVHQAREVAVLGDGAAWIWQLAATHFPEALQIVDFYHASQHLWDLANERFGPESQSGKEWVVARQAELKADRVEAVVRAILSWKPRKQERQRLRKTTAQYFRVNQERMRYGSFLQRGYHIGSGVVEASCKHVVGARLDQAGMHWRQPSADAVVALRAALLSSQPPDLRAYCSLAH